MPRPPRFDLLGVPVHVVQRGNNRAPCFFAESDRYAYLDWLCDAAAHHGVAIHAYVLMTNHVHLLATPLRPRAVSDMMQALGRRYVGHVNRRHARTGTLWEGRFKACLVDSERYVLSAYRYIDLNPVRAAIVCDPAAYRWSSYAAHAGFAPERWLSPHDSYAALGSTAITRGQAYRTLCAEVIESGELDALRAATSGGMVYGSEAFKDRIALSVDRPVRPARRGFAPRR
jgi:putative transposase